MSFGPWPGVTAGGLLAPIFNAGKVDPVADNVFHMAHGNMRFQSPDDSFQLPLLGYWEDVTGQTTATSGYPSEMWSLAVLIGTNNGRRFNLYQMFDPAWDGTFNALNGMVWELERISFVGDDLNHYRNTTPTYASKQWKAAKNWASAAYPQGASGQSTMLRQAEMYNSFDGGLRFMEITNGWGQVDRELTPLQNGITWQWDTHWNAVNIAGAAGDGVGWGIYSGKLDHFNHLQAGLTARQVTGDPLGDWYWSFLVPDGIGGLVTVADFARSGITFGAPLVANGLTAVGQTALLDLTTVANNIPISIPQRAGFYFVPFSARLTIIDSVGVATAGNLTIQYGNDPAHLLYGNTPISVGTWNALAPLAAVNTNIGTGGSSMVDSATAFGVNIATVLTGVTSAHGTLTVAGFWVPT